MTTFAAAFREIVTPALSNAARSQGARLALDLCSFTEAYDHVFGIARQRGALHLSDNLLIELEEWIAGQLLSVFNELEPEVLEYRLIVDQVAADIAKCEAAWTTM